MVELDVLMKFLYRRGFDNYMATYEGGCKIEENSKVDSKDGFAFCLRN